VTQTRPFRIDSRSLRSDAIEGHVPNATGICFNLFSADLACFAATETRTPVNNCNPNVPRSPDPESAPSPIGSRSWRIRRAVMVAAGVDRGRIPHSMNRPGTRINAAIGGKRFGEQHESRPARRRTSIRFANQHGPPSELKLGNVSLPAESDRAACSYLRIGFGETVQGDELRVRAQVVTANRRRSFAIGRDRPCPSLNPQPGRTTVFADDRSVCARSANQMKNSLALSPRNRLCLQTRIRVTN